MGKQGVRVVGTGRASGPPDLIVVEAGVQATAAHPGDAFAAAGRSVTAVREAVLACGVSPADLQTTTLSLHPRHQEPGKPRTHEASVGITITVRAAESVSEIIDAAARAAGESAQLHGISPRHSDPASLSERAREAAFADARAKAEQFARLAGREVGRCLRVDDVPASSAGAPLLRAAAMPVDVADLEVSASVVTTWEFRD